LSAIQEKDKSMREGNQSDKIDARRLAELVRLDHLTPVYHGEYGLRTLKELARNYLTVERSRTRHWAGGSHLSQLGDSLYQQACAVPSGRVAGEDQRTGSAPTG